MNITDFRKEVAGFMNRTEASFVVNSYDILDRAIHKARRWAERRNPFEMAKVDVNIANVSVTTGGLLTAATNADDVTDTVGVKQIIQGFLPLTGAQTGDFPIPVISRKQHLARIQRRYQDVQTVAEASDNRDINPPQFSVVRLANKVYVVGATANSIGSATFTLKLEVHRWMKDYNASTNPTDFFLDYCEDFMLLRSIVELNFFLKEDQRVPISAQALQDAWQSVLAWDHTMASQDAADTTLD